MPTIRDYNQSIIYKTIDFRNQPLEAFATLGAPIIDKPKISPLSAALTFYTLNHMAYIISQHYNDDVDLGEYDCILKAYNKFTAKLGIKIFVYTYAICVRESRHLSKLNPATEVLDAAPIYKAIKGTSGSGAVDGFILNCQTSYKDNVFDQLNKLLHSIFFDHSWGSSFGGKAWGNITNAVVRYINGECSLENLIDTAWTLSHNTGSIFNKGFIFLNDSHGLTELLDVQRSGQMLSYIKSKGIKYDHIENLPLQEYLHLIEKLESIPNKVDWQKVMDLGAVGNYKHLIPKEPKEKLSEQHPFTAALNSKQAKPQEAFSTGMLEEAEEKVQIFPGFVLPKINVRKKHK